MEIEKARRRQAAAGQNFRLMNLGKWINCWQIGLPQGTRLAFWKTEALMEAIASCL